jgi:hypothetical protein
MYKSYEIAFVDDATGERGIDRTFRCKSAESARTQFRFNYGPNRRVLSVTPIDPV